MENLTSLELEINIHQSKAQVWDVLFNRFSEVDNFNPLIESSHKIGGVKGEVGCERQCDMDSRGKKVVHERIVSRDGDNSFEIEVYKGELPMMDKIQGRWSVKDLGNGQTKTSLEFFFSTKPKFMAGIMKMPMKMKMYPMLIALKCFCEIGEKVGKKNIKEVVKKYKRLEKGEAFMAVDNLSKAA